MSGIKPLDVVLMPPSGPAPVMVIVVCAPSGLAGSSVVALAGIAALILRERGRRNRQRQNRARHGDSFSQFVFHKFIFVPRSAARPSSRTNLLEPYVLAICVGRAERGRRRAE